jgi:hypothetical protein
MAQHEQIKREKSEELEEESRHKKKSPQPLYDQLKAPDEGTVDFSVEPSLERHAALLVDTHSDEQRANLVTQLQQSYGNAYVQRLLNSRAVQAKLTVSPPDDEYEIEAERMADAVTQIQGYQIQRQAEEEEEEEEELIQPKIVGSQLPAASQIQRQTEEEEEEEEEALQPKSTGSQFPVVSEDLETRINTARSSGQPLTDSVRASLEPYFGHDFSQVHIHTDAEADRLSQQLGAEAFTTGHDVFFREGAYQPDSESGKELIAHELTHVVQQKAVPALQRQAAAETAEAKAPAAEASKKEAQSQLKWFVGQIATVLDRAYIKGLLWWAARCQLLGLGPGAWQWAIDETAEKATAILEREIAAFDVKSAKEEMVADLLEAVADVQKLGGGEEAAEEAMNKALAAAEHQLAPWVVELRENPSELAAKQVAIKAGRVQLLGGDATEACDLLIKWKIGSSKVKAEGQSRR